MPLDTRGLVAKDEDSPPTVGLDRIAGATMDDIERDRIDRYLFPRPPQDILDHAAHAGLLDPARQIWVRSEGLHVEKPLRFRCGHHAVTERDPGPVALLDLTGADGKTYRAGQCRLCGRIFWGTRGEPWHAE
jgi:hypothetical protein